MCNNFNAISTTLNLQTVVQMPAIARQKVCSYPQLKADRGQFREKSNVTNNSTRWKTLLGWNWFATLKKPLCSFFLFQSLFYGGQKDFDPPPNHMVESRFFATDKKQKTSWCLKKTSWRLKITWTIESRRLLAAVLSITWWKDDKLVDTYNEKKHLGRGHHCRMIRLNTSDHQ